MNYLQGLTSFLPSGNALAGIQKKEGAKPQPPLFFRIDSCSPDFRFVLNQLFS